MEQQLTSIQVVLWIGLDNMMVGLIVGLIQTVVRRPRSIRCPSCKKDFDPEITGSGTMFVTGSYYKKNWSDEILAVPQII